MSGSMMPIAFDDALYDKAVGTFFSAKGLESSASELQISIERDLIQHLARLQLQVDFINDGGVVSISENIGLLNSHHYSQQTGSVVMGVGNPLAYDFYNRSWLTGRVIKSASKHQGLALDFLKKYEVTDAAAVSKFLAVNRDLVRWIISIPDLVKKLVDYSRIEMRVLEDREEDWVNLGIFVFVDSDDIDSLIEQEDAVFDMLEEIMPTNFFKRVNVAVTPR